MVMIKKRVLDTDAYGITDNCSKCGKPLEFAGYESTLVGFFSPEGHSHDDNCRTALWCCRDCGWSCKGQFRKIRNFCKDPECDWQGKEYCGVCNDTKPEALTKIVEVEPDPPKKPYKPLAPGQICHAYSTIGAIEDLTEAIEASRDNRDAFEKIEEDNDE